MTQTDKQAPVTDVKALGLGIEDGEDFEVKIDDVDFTFQPVEQMEAAIAKGETP